jgi:hypothetical protein
MIDGGQLPPTYRKRAEWGRVVHRPIQLNTSSLEGEDVVRGVRNVRRITRLGLVKGFAGRCRAVSQCSVGAVAAAGLLLPERFSQCCLQPGYRAGYDQG